MSLITNLGYEQLRALSILSKATDKMEGVALCSQAGCSWDEMFSMAESGLLNMIEDDKAKRLYSTLTEKGRLAAQEANTFLEEPQ